MEKVTAWLFTESGMGQYILGIFAPSLQKVIKFQTIKLFSFIDAYPCKDVCGTQMKIEIDPAGFEEAYNFYFKGKRNKQRSMRRNRQELSLLYGNHSRSQGLTTFI